MNKENKTESSLTAKYTTNAQQLIYVNLLKKTNIILLQAKVTVLIESTQIRWFSEQSDGRLDLKSGSQRCSKLAQLGPSGSSLFRSNGSCGGQAGGCTL
jgi:hypothetical protein